MILQMSAAMHQAILNSQAVIYGRVSTDQQTTSTQELRCKEYVQYKRLNLVEEFYDDDISGAVAIWERPSGRRLGARLKAGDIRHIVIAKLSGPQSLRFTEDNRIPRFYRRGPSYSRSGRR